MGARLLGPAPAPEDPRGVAVAGDDRRPGARELAERAIRAVVAAGYENVGTLEFLVDNDGNAYFIEINCRIQVEHPVTEMLTGIDLVAHADPDRVGRAARVHPGGRRPQRGHAIEFRINAEDPEHDFRPGAGTIERFNAPGGPGVRFDSHAYAGLRGAAVLRLAARQARRLGRRPARRAIARGRAALDELVIDGVVTNAQIHRALLVSEPFLDGRFTTNLLDRVGGAAFLAGAVRVVSAARRPPRRAPPARACSPATMGALDAPAARDTLSDPAWSPM